MSNSEKATDIVMQINNLLSYISGICDERDSVPLLLEMRRVWPLARAEIERLRSERGRGVGAAFDA
jgi:hypothetical protein